MGAKWFCNKCGKEIWEGLDRNSKESETVFDMEKMCVCSDCLLDEIVETRKKEKSK